jgi:hypothetical protein
MVEEQTSTGLYLKQIEMIIPVPQSIPETEVSQNTSDVLGYKPPEHVPWLSDNPNTPSSQYVSDTQVL